MFQFILTLASLWRLGKRGSKIKFCPISKSFPWLKFFIEFHFTKHFILISRECSEVVCLRVALFMWPWWRKKGKERMLGNYIKSNAPTLGLSTMCFSAFHWRTIYLLPLHVHKHSPHENAADFFLSSLRSSAQQQKLSIHFSFPFPHSINFFSGGFSVFSFSFSHDYFFYSILKFQLFLPSESCIINILKLLFS